MGLLLLLPQSHRFGDNKLAGGHEGVHNEFQKLNILPEESCLRGWIALEIRIRIRALR